MDAAIENKAGFKKTKLGWIPEDWDVVRLNELLSLLTDFEANGSFADVKANVSVVDRQGFAWYVRATDLEKESDLSEVKYVDEHSYNFLKKTPLYGDEVLVTKRGEIGKVYYFKSKNIQATLAPNLYLLKLNGKVVPKFLYYFLKSYNGFKSLNRINASTTMGALYKDDVKKLNIPFPPLPEQQKIAKILSTWDKAIEKLEQLISEKEQLKKGLMQQLLTGQKRFPGFTDEWEVVRIENLLETFQNGYAFSAKGYVKSGIPIITMAHIGLDGQFQKDLSKMNYWPEKDLEILSNYKLTEGDLIISMTDVTPGKNLIGRMTIVKGKKTYLLNQRVGLLRLITEKCNPAFLSLISNHENWRNHCKRIATLGVQANISTKDIKQSKVRIPSLEEQNLISNFLMNYDNEIGLLNKQLVRVTEQKKGLMQKLLTGEVRVKV